MTVIHTKSAFKSFADGVLRKSNQLDTLLHARLPEGLMVALERKVDDDGLRRWRMVLSREQHWPTDAEILGCCLNFDVPPWFEQRRTRLSSMNPKSGRPVQHHIVEIRWQEQNEVAKTHDDA